VRNRRSRHGHAKSRFVPIFTVTLPFPRLRSRWTVTDGHGRSRFLLICAYSTVTPRSRRRSRPHDHGRRVPFRGPPRTSVWVLFFVFALPLFKLLLRCWFYVVAVRPGCPRRFGPGLGRRRPCSPLPSPAGQSRRDRFPKFPTPRKCCAASGRFSLAAALPISPGVRGSVRPAGGRRRFAEPGRGLPPSDPDFIPPKVFATADG